MTVTDTGNKNLTCDEHLFPDEYNTFFFKNKCIYGPLNWHLCMVDKKISNFINDVVISTGLTEASYVITVICTQNICCCG